MVATKAISVPAAHATKPAIHPNVLPTAVRTMGPKTPLRPIPTKILKPNILPASPGSFIRSNGSEPEHPFVKGTPAPAIAAMTTIGRYPIGATFGQRIVVTVAQVKPMIIVRTRALIGVIPLRINRSDTIPPNGVITIPTKPMTNRAKLACVVL